MENKIFNEVEKTIEKVNTKTENDKIAFAKKADEIKISTATSANAMEKAMLAGDLDKYRNHKIDNDFYSAQLEMCTKKLNVLKSDSLISSEEYDKLTEKVLAEMNIVYENYKAKVLDLVEQLTDTNNAFREAYDTVEDIEKNLFYLRYRAKTEPCAVKSDTGAITVHKIRHFDNYGIMNNIDELHRHLDYTLENDR